NDYYDRKIEEIKEKIHEKYKQSMLTNENKAKEIFSTDIHSSKNRNLLNRDDNTASEFDMDRISIKLSNLPPQTSQENIKSLLSKKKLESKGVVLSKYRYNQTRDFAFIKFEDKEKALNAINALNNLVYNNFHLRAEIARPPSKRT
ncbi:MAG: hypothetical protein MHPSP_000200, partial [Paramarteilia canceri]